MEILYESVGTLYTYSWCLKIYDHANCVIFIDFFDDYISFNFFVFL